MSNCRFYDQYMSPRPEQPPRKQWPDFLMVDGEMVLIPNRILHDYQLFTGTPMTGAQWQAIKNREAEKGTPL